MHTQKGLAPVVWIIIAAIILGGGYVAYQKYQQPTTDNRPQQTDDNSSQEKQASADTSDWKTYRNEKYGFELQYPKVSESFSTEEWFAFDEGDYCVSFGPVSSRSGGFVWGICAYDPGRFNREKVISEIGSQFLDRKQSSTKSTISGADALIVVTTTDQYPRWVSKMVFIEHEGRSFHFSNGAVRNPDFDTTLSTFKFTK